MRETLGDPEKRKEVPFADGGSAEQALLLRILSMNREYIDSKAENKEAQKANERTG